MQLCPEGRAGAGDFIGIELAALKYLVKVSLLTSSLAYFGKGQTLVAPQYGVAKRILIVQAGFINGVEQHAKMNAAPAITLTLSEGECFPMAH